MDIDKFIADLNRNAPPAVQKLNGRVSAINQADGTLDLEYRIDASFCHSGDVVQGGFVAGMLDAAMAHATFAHLGKYVIVASLEIKVSYLDIARPGTLTGRGRAVKIGKSVGFLEAELLDADGTLLATATSTARIIRKRPPGSVGNFAGDR
jgi:uncharacterized protein (TIGR00369 family)